MIKLCSLGVWNAPGDTGLSLSAILPRKQAPPICHFLGPSSCFSSWCWQWLLVTHQSKVSQMTAMCLGLYQNTPDLGNAWTVGLLLMALDAGCLWLSQVKISANSSVSRGSLVIDDTFYLVCTGQKGEAISLISCCKDTHPHPHDIKLRNSQRFHFLRVLDFTMWMQTFWPQQLQ